MCLVAITTFFQYSLPFPIRSSNAFLPLSLFLAFLLFLAWTSNKKTSEDNKTEWNSCLSPKPPALYIHPWILFYLSTQLLLLQTGMNTEQPLTTQPPFSLAYITYLIEFTETPSISTSPVAKEAKKSGFKGASTDCPALTSCLQTCFMVGTSVTSLTCAQNRLESLSGHDCRQSFGSLRRRRWIITWMSRSIHVRWRLARRSTWFWMCCWAREYFSIIWH